MLTLALGFSCFAQVDVPTNVYFTISEIRGYADSGTSVKIDRNQNGVAGLPVITVAVNINGYFEYAFETPIVQPGIAVPSVVVWAEDNAGVTSAALIVDALTAAQAIEHIKSGTLTLPTNATAISSRSHNPEIDGLQPASTTFRYKIKMLNTNFTVPLARFNFDNQSDLKLGEIVLFNSVGAGIGVSWGEMEKTTDATGATINTDFTNTFGIHLGVLFSSGKDGNEQKNIFAPTLSVSLLDFQIGLGYEMGSVTENQRKGFVTIAYAIPLSKLLKGKYYIFRASKGYNDTNPLPVIPGSNVSTRAKNRFIN